MSWTITPAEKTPVDKQGIGSVSLLLHGNGTNGSTAIVDSSLTSKTVTVNGNAQISTTQSKFGGSSIVFDGSGDSLTLSTDQSFTLTNDFTIELWLYINNMKVSGVIANGAASFGSNAFAIILNHGTQLNKLALFNYPSSVTSVVATAALNTNQWYHVAFVRSGSSVTPYLNGTAGSSANDANTYPLSSTLLKVGAYWGGDFDGYIDDLRITKGVARYTANFTPPTAPFPDI